MPLQIIISFSFAVSLILWLRSRGKQLQGLLPPGPKPQPIVGNVFDFTLKEFWLRVTTWAEEYGDVIYLKIFNENLVFLNSVEAASDLLEKRGSIYSDRPQTTMGSELCGCDHIIAFAPYGHPNFRRQRRMMHDALAPAKMHTYHTIMTDSVSVFLKRMLDSPEDYVQNIRRYTGGQIASIVYGYKTDEDHDPYLNTADETLSLIANHILSVGSGVWVVDIFPWIKHLPSWFPGAGFKSKANAWRRKIEHCADVPFASVKERMVDGTTIASYCTTMFTEMEQEMNSRVGDPRHEYDIRWTANSMYLASIDTTLALVVHFVLAMVQYPNVARKAQQAIDVVTGMSRLPTFEDRNALPYIDAVLSECMRWTAPVPFGLPHRLTEDDVYNSMTIPAGTLVSANIWKMSRDPMLFPDPDAFVPERYLKTMDEATARKRDPYNFIFGFGRRKCSGTHLVNAYLWLVIARFLATFDFDKAKDTEGRDIEPQPEYHDASFRLPTPFPCVIRPRSERAAQLVHDALSACT